MNTLAIIPARAGSKGIPRKNLAPLGGQPLLAYTLRAAREARSIDLAVVSTDGREIGELAEKYGVESIPRPRSLSGDRSPTIDAVLHVIETLASRGVHPKRVVLLQPTSPFRNGKHIDEAVATFLRSGRRSLMSVCSVAQHPCECVAMLGGRLRPAVAPPSNFAGRQDYPEYFFINGAIYITDVKMLRQRRKFWDVRSATFQMSQSDSIDIDDLQHLALAEALLVTRSEAHTSLPLRTGRRANRARGQARATRGTIEV